MNVNDEAIRRAEGADTGGRGVPAVQTRPVIRIRILLGDGFALGPGKADLLAAIAEHGSIAAAGRSMAMSYQRAWSLVEELNNAFRTPLVEVSRGGAARGGARLTTAGREVVDTYRAIERKAADRCAAEFTSLTSLLKPEAQEDADISHQR